MDIREMVIKRQEIEKELDKLAEIIDYLSVKHDDLLDKLKDIDSELADIEHTIIRGFENE
jgi:peptidoglycan hydrolase CwlO-like protein